MAVAVNDTSAVDVHVRLSVSNCQQQYIIVCRW